MPVNRLYRRPELDGLRGVAILAVLLFHARVPALAGGFIGVESFFVLSGFLITSLLLGEFQAEGRIQLGNFFIRRALRLMPALTLMLVVFVVAGWLFAPRWLAVSNSVDAVIAFLNFSNWARVFGWRPHNMIGHTWSLGIEQQFYLLWAPIVTFALRLQGPRLVLALAVLLGVGSWGWRVTGVLRGESFDRLYNGLDTRADGLMLGAAAAVLASLGVWERGVGGYLLRVSHRIAALWLGGLLAASVFANWQSPAMYVWGFATVEVLTLLVILDALYFPEGWLGRCLRMRWLVWIGVISYGLYIWHYPLFQLLLFGFHWSPGWVALGGGILATAIAVTSFYLIEKPALRLKKRFG